MRPIRHELAFGTTRLRGAPAQCRRAVTIIELVIVVMVMSIMAAVAMPSFLDSLLFHRVESAARRVKADIELTRHTARLTSAAQSMTFANTTYTLSAAMKALDRPGDTYFVDLAAPPYEVSSVTANFNATTAVSFDGYGSPSSGGTVVLALKGHQCTLTLNGATGEVSIASSH